MTRADLLDPVQGQVVAVFAHCHPGEQARRSHAAVDDGRRHRRRNHPLARAASVLGADVAVHEEACRFHVELLADVFADQRQALATGVALTGLRFMPVLDPFEFRRQRLTARAAALALTRRPIDRIVRRRQLGQDRGQIGIDGLLEQFALFAAERLVLLAEADTAVVRKFQRQRRDLAVFLGQPGRVLRQRLPGLLGLIEQRAHLLNHDRIELIAG